MRTGYLLRRELRYRWKTFLLTVAVAFLSGLLFWQLLLTTSQMTTTSLVKPEEAAQIGESLGKLPKGTLADASESFVVLEEGVDPALFLLGGTVSRQLDIPAFFSDNRDRLSTFFSSAYVIRSFTTSVEIRGTRIESLRIESLPQLVWEAPVEGNLLPESRTALSGQMAELTPALATELGLGEDELESPYGLQLKLRIFASGVENEAVELPLRSLRIRPSQGNFEDHTLFLNGDTFERIISSLGAEAGNRLVLVPGFQSFDEINPEQFISFLESDPFAPRSLVYDSRVFDVLEVIGERIDEDVSLMVDRAGSFATAGRQQAGLVSFFILLALFIPVVLIFIFLIVKGMADRHSTLVQLFRLGFSERGLRFELILYYGASLAAASLLLSIVIAISAYVGRGI